MDVGPAAQSKQSGGLRDAQYLKQLLSACNVPGYFLPVAKPYQRSPNVAYNRYPKPIHIRIPRRYELDGPDGTAWPDLIGHEADDAYRIVWHLRLGNDLCPVEFIE
jgi:hypothetical protein